MERKDNAPLFINVALMENVSSYELKIGMPNLSGAAAFLIDI